MKNINIFKIYAVISVYCLFFLVLSSCSFFTPEKIAKDEEILLNATEEIIEVGIGVEHEKCN